MDGQFSRFDSEIHRATLRARGDAAAQLDAMEIGRAAAIRQLESAWQQFQAASFASGRALEAGRSAPGTDPRTVTLTWTAGAPRRTLTLQATEVGGHIYWELRADFATVDVYSPDDDIRSGVVPATALTSDVIHKLIIALLKQDTWGKGKLPDVLVPGSMVV